jgi:hypothetical protein
MKLKHIGRPFNLSLPSWAQKRIAEMARAAGASEKKVLELTLQAGIVEIEELYKPIIAYSKALRTRALPSHEVKPPVTSEVDEPEPEDLDVLETELEQVGEFAAFDQESGPGDAPERSGLGSEIGADPGLDPEADRITGAGNNGPAIEEITSP